MFFVNWVLIDEIAIGPCPRNNNDLNQIKSMGIKNILSLCSEEESQMSLEINKGFQYERIVLPDHKKGRVPKVSELMKVLKCLKILKLNGPVFVHCVASVERSPLVCIAWLVLELNLSTNEAIEYMMEVHPPTNPLSEQLEIIRKLKL